MSNNTTYLQALSSNNKKHTRRSFKKLISNNAACNASLFGNSFEYKMLFVLIIKPNKTWQEFKKRKQSYYFEGNSDVRIQIEYKLANNNNQNRQKFGSLIYGEPMHFEKSFHFKIFWKLKIIQVWNKVFRLFGQFCTLNIKYSNSQIIDGLIRRTDWKLIFAKWLDFSLYTFRSLSVSSQTIARSDQSDPIIELFWSSVFQKSI